MTVCSIYLITNTINDKVYVGQTWQSLKERFYAHCNKHPYKSKIKNAINKYGRDNFTIELLVTCDNQKIADALEKFWINTYDSINTGYNIKEGGSRGKFSEETKLKMSLAKIGKSAWNKGKATSFETRIKISKNSTKTIHLTESQIQEIRSDKRSYEQIAKDYPCSSKTISRICKGQKK